MWYCILPNFSHSGGCTAIFLSLLCNIIISNISLIFMILGNLCMLISLFGIFFCEMLVHLFFPIFCWDFLSFNGLWGFWYQGYASLLFNKTNLICLLVAWSWGIHSCAEFFSSVTEDIISMFFQINHDEEDKVLCTLYIVNQSFNKTTFIFLFWRNLGRCEILGYFP